MSNLATHPDEEMNSKGQRKEIFYTAEACCRKRQSKHFHPSSGYRPWALGLKRGRIGEGEERYTQLNNPRKSVSVVVLRGVP
jgi:hypothetical protein